MLKQFSDELLAAYGDHARRIYKSHGHLPATMSEYKPPTQSRSPQCVSQPGVLGAAKLVPRLRSEDLFGDAEEVLIEHNGRIYILTRGPAGGLVLRA